MAGKCLTPGEQAIIDKLCELIELIGETPQIEGLGLQQFCLDGAITGYVAVTLNEKTSVTSSVYFDAALQPTAAAPAGEPSNSGGPSSSAADIGLAVEASNTYKGPTAQEIANASVLAQRNVTPAVFSWINETNTVSLPVSAGARGEIVSIEDFGAGLVRWSIDGSDPIGGDAPEFTTTGAYHAAYALKNVPLDLVRLNGSSTGSDFSIAYLIYN